MARGSKSKYASKQNEKQSISKRARKARHIEERSRTPGLGHREQGEWRRQKERKWARREREQGELSQRRENGLPKKETLSGL